MITINKSDIKRTPSAELVKFYNANSGRGPIIKFTNRATAEKRVRQLIELLTQDEPIPAKEAQPVKVKASKPAKVAKVAKPAKAPVDPAEAAARRSASVAKSWRDPAVHAARAPRNGCKVAGEVFTSVPMAFRALKLDMKKMQRVRREMVVNGHTTFEGQRFTLVRD